MKGGLWPRGHSLRFFDSTMRSLTHHTDRRGMPKKSKKTIESAESVPPPAEPVPAEPAPAEPAPESKCAADTCPIASPEPKKRKKAKVDAEPPMPEPETAAPEDDAVMTEAAKEKKPRKKRVPRDPNKPKRPLNGFMLFSNEQRKAFAPATKITEVAQQIGQLWRDLSEEERLIWKNKALELKPALAPDAESAATEVQ